MYIIHFVGISMDYIIYIYISHVQTNPYDSGFFQPLLIDDYIRLYQPLCILDDHSLLFNIFV